MATKIAIISYETPFAPAGGIAAVMKHLPGALAGASEKDVYVLSPFHRRIAGTAELPVEHVGRVHVLYRDSAVDIDLMRHKTDEVSWVFLRTGENEPAAWESPVFNGYPHPYLVDRLLRDSLIFGTGAAKALTHLDADADWIVLLQDWEAATTVLALATKGVGRSRWRCFLTLHNSYDCPVDDEALCIHGIYPKACPGGTVLDRAIPLTQDTIFTVSDQFAEDLTGDVLQSHVMASHLSGLLAPRVRGVSNGPFVELAVPELPLADAERGKFTKLKKWKAENREKAVAALEAFEPSEEKPVWGDLDQFRGEQDEDLPWLVMPGRDDPRQKGYDVAAAGIRKFLKRGGRARFFFFPIPGDEGLSGLGFLKQLAEEFPRYVAVFPFRWVEGFVGTLRGAALGLMPSLYEPFGMANEFYLNGTVGIGRATGGIVQQIVPVRGVASFSHAAQTQAARWHGSSAPPTGLLYREQTAGDGGVSDWHAINHGGYRIDGNHPNRLEQRCQFPLFRAMADELALAIEDGVRLYVEENSRYYSMLTEGIAFVQRSLSWPRAAHEYWRTVR